MDKLIKITDRELKRARLEHLPLGWQAVRLGSITKESQYGLSESEHVDGNIPMLRMNNILDGRIDYTDVVYLRLTDEEKDDFLLHKGDVLINRTNSYALVGKSALYEAEGEHTFASYLVRFVLDEMQVEPRFVNYYLNSLHAKHHLKSLATVGVSQCNINPTTLKRHFLLPLPPKKEQERITAILTSWDAAIEKTTALIAAKQKLKTGLMQKLLSGKVRFKEFTGQKWRKTELGDFLKPASRPVPRPDKEYTAMGLRSHGKGTFLRTVDDPSAVMMDTLYDVREDDLIVNITFAWEGAIALVNKSDEGALVSHRFPTYTFKRDKVIPEYFRHVIMTKRFVHQLGIISPGGAGRNRVMSKKDFLDLVVSVPSVVEQKRIADLLNGIDRELDLLNNKLENLKTQKKGLMQQLLTGRKRLKV